MTKSAHAADVRYAAGFFDADGCIAVLITNELASLQLIFTNIHLGVLEEFQSWFGGNIKAKPMHKGWQQSYDLTISGRESQEKVLRALLPHLRVKRDQAHVALELLSNIGPRGTRVTPECKERRLELAARLKELRHNVRCIESR